MEPHYIKLSKKTNYDWYIKCHPLYGGRYKIYQKFSNNIVNDFIKENNHIKLLPNNASNKQLIEEGINTVLTVYGTVASEFPFFVSYSSLLQQVLYEVYLLHPL